MEQLSVSNQNPDNPIHQKAAELANRLRLVQVDFADKPAEDRQGFMSDALNSGLSGLTPEHRREVVALLIERFPSWDANVQIGAGALAAPVQAKADDDERNDPSYHMARLIELASRMTPGEKQAAAEELKRAGFALQGEGGLPEGPLTALQKVLGHTAKDRIEPGRVVEMAELLLDVMTLQLDPLVTQLWKRMAPNSLHKKQETLRVTLSRFAAGDRETVRAQVEREIGALRKLTSALLSATAGASPQVVQKQMERFGPTEIERAVKDEGVKWSFEATCWNRYKTLCASMDRNVAEREVMAIIVKEAERLLR